jgi:hypothetical protein
VITVPKRPIPKPIALLTDSVPHAIQWALTNYPGQINKYTRNKKEIILRSGQLMIICSRPEDLLALEISDYKVAGGLNKPQSYFNNLMRLAETRIR